MASYLSSSSSSSAFEVLHRPYPVAIVTIKQAHVPLAILPVLQLLDDMRTQADGFFSLTGNSHELSLVSSSSGISDRFRLFADFVTIEPGWRLFQVELCPEELSEPGGAGGSGVRVQQISRLLTANGVSIYYTCSDTNDYFLCRSTDYGIACAALARQGWLSEGSTSTGAEIPLDLVLELELDRPRPLPRIVDDGSESGSDDTYDDEAGPLSADVVSSLWLDCRSALPSPAACSDGFGLACESASEDISSASPTATQTLFPRPPHQLPANVRIGFKSSFGLVNTHLVLGSPGVGAFLRRWALGDASDHPFFCCIADGCADEVGWGPLQVAVYGNATTIERFVPGSVAPEDLDEAEEACRTLFTTDSARRASAPSLRPAKGGGAGAASGLTRASTTTGHGERRSSPAAAQRHSLALGELTHVERWIEAVGPQQELASPSAETTVGSLGGTTRRHSVSEDLGCTRVWGSVEIHLCKSDGQPSVVHSFTDQLAAAGIDHMAFSTSTSVNLLCKLLQARRIVQAGH